MSFATDLNARLAEGDELAAAFAGLKRDIAVERVKAGGFEVQAMPATGEAIGASLAANRIRLLTIPPIRCPRSGVNPSS